MLPNKLKKGDEVRVIAPATSLGAIDKNQIKQAISRLEDLGLHVSFSKNAMKVDDFRSSSVEERVEDIHEAFADPYVKGTLTTLGGFNSNQLLKYIDYDLIQNNPKILCGYSDITALSHAIYKKTGLVGYSGPHFSTFGMKHGFEYTYDYFQKCLMQDDPFLVKPSEHWSDDEWYINQEKREFHENPGPVILQQGKGEGKILGGNLCTFNLLQGTEYMPSLKDAILFVEDDKLVLPQQFDRDLQSVIHLPDFKEVKGILIGRFQRGTNMSMGLLKKIISSKRELKELPVVANVNFGHVSPIFTFPIGGTVSVDASGEDPILQVMEH